MPSVASERSLLSLREACDVFEQMSGRRPHIETVRRWIAVGVGGRRLSVVYVGRTPYVTREAVERFVAGAEGGAAC